MLLQQNWIKNGKPMSTQNRIIRKDYNKKLGDEDMNADDSTAGFTMFSGRIITQRKSDRL
jgi:hypothetical protein